jgi:hypothetical protein
MRDNKDALTAALKQQFSIGGVFASHHKDHPGDPEWRIESMVVRRIPSINRSNWRIRGLSHASEQPLSYTQWWLFWAAVHVHRKFFPAEYTEEAIRQKFEEALKEQAEVSGQQQQHDAAGFTG